MTISLRIKELRKQNKVSQKEFAGSIGIDDSQLSKIERGVLQPTLSQIMEISSIYKISTDWLLLGTKAEITATENIDYKELADARVEIIQFLKEKISRLEKELAAIQSTSQEPIIYSNVAEPTPELSEKRHR